MLLETLAKSDGRESGQEVCVECGGTYPPSRQQEHQEGSGRWAGQHRGKDRKTSVSEELFWTPMCLGCLRHPAEASVEQ